jgi:hypothetical protein
MRMNLSLYQLNFSKNQMPIKWLVPAVLKNQRTGRLQTILIYKQSATSLTHSDNLFGILLRQTL